MGDGVRPGWLGRLFPAGMRRRWWAFRPIDWLVALVPPRSPRRGVLLVRIDGLGDMALFRPFLDHYPAALGVAPGDITILGSFNWGGLADTLFAGYKVVTIDEGAVHKRPFYRLKVGLWLRRQGFHTVICGQFFRKGLVADSLVRFAAGTVEIVAKPYISDKTRREFAYYLGRAQRVIDAGSGLHHELDHNRDFLAGLLGRAPDLGALRLPWRDVPPPLPAGPPYAVLNFGSHEPGRHWPLENFLVLASRLLERGLRVVFVGGKPELAARPRIAAALGGHPGVLDLIARTDLPGLLDVLAGARLLISNETGPGHIGALLGTPMVMICGGGAYGTFVPYPESMRLPSARFLFHPMPCFHCLWHCTERKVDRTPFPCVLGVTLEQVWDQAESLLDGLNINVRQATD